MPQCFGKRQSKAKRKRARPSETNSGWLKKFSRNMMKRFSDVIASVLWNAETPTQQAGKYETAYCQSHFNSNDSQHQLMTRQA